MLVASIYPRHERTYTGGKRSHMEGAQTLMGIRKWSEIASLHSQGRHCEKPSDEAIFFCKLASEN